METGLILLAAGLAAAAFSRRAAPTTTTPPGGSGGAPPAATVAPPAVAIAPLELAMARAQRGDREAVRTLLALTAVWGFLMGRLADADLVRYFVEQERVRSPAAQTFVAMLRDGRALQIIGTAFPEVRGWPLMPDAYEFIVNGRRPSPPPVRPSEGVVRPVNAPPPSATTTPGTPLPAARNIVLEIVDEAIRRSGWAPTQEMYNHAANVAARRLVQGESQETIVRALIALIPSLAPGSGVQLVPGPTRRWTPTELVDETLRRSGFQPNADDYRRAVAFVGQAQEAGELDEVIIARLLAFIPELVAQRRTATPVSATVPAPPPPAGPLAPARVDAHSVAQDALGLVNAEGYRPTQAQIDWGYETAERLAAAGYTAERIFDHLVASARSAAPRVAAE